LAGTQKHEQSLLPLSKTETSFGARGTKVRTERGEKRQRLPLLDMINLCANRLGRRDWATRFVRIYLAGTASCPAAPLISQNWASVFAKRENRRRPWWSRLPVWKSCLFIRTWRNSRDHSRPVL